MITRPLCFFAGTLACAVSAYAGASPTEPVPQGGNWVRTRHEEKVKLARAHTYGLLMIGDSITNNFEHAPYAGVWAKHFAPYDALNLGYSGARTENILWNLTHGELDNQAPKVVTLLIGTNNGDDANYPVAHTPEQIFAGTKAIVDLLRAKCPEAKIIVLRVFPRTNVYKTKDGKERGSARNRWETTRRAGELAARLADGKQVFYLDINASFLEADGKTIVRKLMPDLLHPSPEGAEVWAKAMAPLLAKLYGPKPALK